MDDHAGRITIIASSTMVHHRVRCMICDRPVDHRVVFMTNDARVLHAGCVPDHVKVPIAVLLQAIRRLERMVDRARASNGHDPDPPTPGGRSPDPPTPGGRDPDPPTREAGTPRNREPGNPDPSPRDPDPRQEPRPGS
jgi:hypothetical protein